MDQGKISRHGYDRQERDEGQATCPCCGRPTGVELIREMLLVPTGLVIGAGLFAAGAVFMLWLG